MSMQVNRTGYVDIIEGDIDFIKRNIPKELLCHPCVEHIVHVLTASIDLLYPTENPNDLENFSILDYIRTEDKRAYREYVSLTPWLKWLSEMYGWSYAQLQEKFNREVNERREEVSCSRGSGIFLTREEFKILPKRMGSYISHIKFKHKED